MTITSSSSALTESDTPRDAQPGRIPARSWGAALLLGVYTLEMTVLTWPFFLDSGFGFTIFALFATGLLALLARAITPALPRYALPLSLGFGAALGAFLSSTFSLFALFIAPVAVYQTLVVLFLTGFSVCLLGFLPVRWPGTWPRALAALGSGALLFLGAHTFLAEQTIVPIINAFDLVETRWERIVAGIFMGVILLFGARQLSREATTVEESEDPRHRRAWVGATLLTTGYLAFCGGIVMLFGSGSGDRDHDHD